MFPPINQFVLGNNDPLNLDSIDAQIQKMEELRRRMQNIPAQQAASSPIWDSIDNEVNVLTLEQKEILKRDNVYSELNNQLSQMVSNEILNLVKSKIEYSENGRQLLQRLLEVVKRKKETVIKESNMEMDLFRSFKEFSKTHPNMTYDEFLKASISNNNKNNNNNNGIEASDNGRIA